jgi:hypothetical protein
MTILSDEPLGDDSQIPNPALILGAAGAIPFLAGGVALIVTAMRDGTLRRWMLSAFMAL